MVADRGEMNVLKKSSLAWQVGAGMNMVLGQNLGFDLNVCDMDFGKTQIGVKGAFSTSADVPFNRSTDRINLSFLNELSISWRGLV